MSPSDSALFETAAHILDRFQIEIPSWGFANTGTRFGSSFSPPPPLPSKRNSTMPPKCIA